jgi:predicted amidophosphoribosyltransferase
MRGSVMRWKEWLLKEEENKCIHCHNNKPMTGRSICSKCDKELDKLRKNKDGIKS